MDLPTRSISVLDAINQRHSVRSFTPQKLDRDTIHKLLAAAVRAPTAVHEEPWAFVIVQDAELLKRISDRAKPLFLEEMHRAHLDRGGRRLDIFGQAEFNIFHDAGTLIVVCGRGAGPFVAADCWLAAENLMLAAHAMGLGTCVIGSALQALDLPEVKAEVGIPAEYSAIAPIIVGVPAGEGAPSARKAPHVLVWK